MHKYGHFGRIFITVIKIAAFSCLAAHLWKHRKTAGAKLGSTFSLCCADPRPSGEFPFGGMSCDRSKGRV